MQPGQHGYDIYKCKMLTMLQARLTLGLALISAKQRGSWAPMGWNRRERVPGSGVGVATCNRH